MEEEAREKKRLEKKAREKEAAYQERSVAVLNFTLDSVVVCYYDIC